MIIIIDKSELRREAYENIISDFKDDYYDTEEELIKTLKKIAKISILNDFGLYNPDNFQGKEYDNYLKELMSLERELNAELASIKSMVDKFVNSKEAYL